MRTDILKVVLGIAVGMALVVIPIAKPELADEYPMLQYTPVVGFLVPLFLYASLWGQVRMHGLDVILKPQKQNEVLILYHTATGRIIPLEGIESFDGTIKVKNHFGRLINPRRSAYVLFNKKVVHAMAGVCHTVPPKVAMFANILRDRGYQTLGQAIAAETDYLRKLPEGALKDECRKVLQKEEIWGEKGEAENGA